MVLTTEFWRDRILGRSENITLPVRQTWIATGNNVRIRGDLARRSYRVRIDTEHERPWERHEFRHPELLAWVADHRGDILAKLCTMILAYFQAGCPPQNTPHMGGFEQWVTLVGGILGVGLARGLGSVDRTVTRNIFGGWLITVPAAGGVAMILFLIARALFLN